MKLIIAVVQPHRFPEIKKALYDSEVFKMTVTDALGCGQQKGYPKGYTGKIEEVNLLKKVRIEIAVNEDFVESTINAIIKGARVRKMYELFAKRFGVKWEHRDYDPDNWDGSDLPNKCLSAATAALYGITEAAVLAAGYAPASRFHLYMISQIYLNLKLLCRLHFKLRRKNRLILKVMCVMPAVKFFAVHVCWKGLFLL